MAEGCPITMANMEYLGHRKGGRGYTPKCGKPLAPGADFCAKHEADRIRMIESDKKRGIKHESS